MLQRSTAAGVIGLVDGVPIGIHPAPVGTPLPLIGAVAQLLGATSWARSSTTLFA